jgi:hypothetical protein
LLYCNWIGLIHRLAPPAGSAPDRMSQIGGRPLIGLINRLREGVYSLEKTVAALRQLKSEALITNLSGRVILRCGLVSASYAWH